METQRGNPSLDLSLIDVIEEWVCVPHAMEEKMIRRSLRRLLETTSDVNRLGRKNKSRVLRCATASVPLKVYRIIVVGKNRTATLK